MDMKLVTAVLLVVCINKDKPQDKNRYVANTTATRQNEKGNMQLLQRPAVVSCKPDDPVPTAGRARKTVRPTFRPTRYVGTSYPTRYDTSEGRCPVFSQ